MLEGKRLCRLLCGKPLAFRPRPPPSSARLEGSAFQPSGGGWFWASAPRKGEAFPQIRRQSRFGILSFGDFDATLPITVPRPLHFGDFPPRGKSGQGGAVRIIIHSPRWRINSFFCPVEPCPRNPVFPAPALGRRPFALEIASANTLSFQ